MKLSGSKNHFQTIHCDFEKYNFATIQSTHKTLKITSWNQNEIKINLKFQTDLIKTFTIQIYSNQIIQWQQFKQTREIISYSIYQLLSIYKLWTSSNTRENRVPTFNTFTASQPAIQNDTVRRKLPSSSVKSKLLFVPVDGIVMNDELFTRMREKFRAGRSCEKTRQTPRYETLIHAIWRNLFNLNTFSLLFL